ncbi:recombinase family protein [Microbacterium allomyrinae]|uniref:Recombinase family protein n=1 Tax=Microbacterium allomyrinae TaxID=2830666 RepID=A0A9X1S3G7_9MICO|nr:recombinase family protein [Microbacterium allomyrinae]MCC2031948.1 recombinase family protein [Microbacterium allomyrinae]
MSQIPLRAAIYARLSTAQNDKGNAEPSDSIETQLADLRKMLSANGYEAAGEFVDDGMSGYSGKTRPAFTRLLSAMDDGEVDIILARHQDRLTRNEEEATILRVGSVKKKVTWQFASGMTVDPSTAEGGLLAKILDAIAQFESQVKSERIRREFERMRTEGEFPAPANTFGYDGFEIVEWEADHIRAAYVHMDEGKSISSLVKLWNELQIPQRKGGKKGWTHAHIRAILLRPRNAGLVADKEGHLIEGVYGSWTPIVDEELWRRVTHTIGSGTSFSPGFKPTHMSTASAICGKCGFKTKSNTSQDKTGNIKILNCANPQRNGERHPSGHVAEVDALIRKAVIDAFAYGTTKELGDGTADVLSVQAQVKELQARRGEFIALRNSGAITAAELKKVLDKSNEPLAKLQAKLEGARTRSASAHMLVDLRAGFIDPVTHVASFEGMAELQKELASRFDALPLEQRRHLARTYVQVRLLGGKNREYEVSHLKVLSLNPESEEAWA